MKTLLPANSLRYFAAVFCLPLLANLVMSCSHSTVKPRFESQLQTLESKTTPDTHLQVAFVSHPDWLGLQLQPTPFETLKKAVETAESLTLKSRREAHITVITPPEFAGFQGKIPMPELEALVKNDIQAANWSAVCVGKGESKVNSQLKTYFVVIKSSDLFAVRQKIKTLTEAKGVGSTFSPNQFYPHVTLGFTERDLHFQDGVIKDSSSCLQTQ